MVYLANVGALFFELKISPWLLIIIFNFQEHFLNYSLEDESDSLQALMLSLFISEISLPSSSHFLLNVLLFSAMHFVIVCLHILKYPNIMLVWSWKEEEIYTC